MLRDQRVRRVKVPPARAFAPIRRIGGRQGWYFLNGLWRLRSWLDVLLGGPGLRGRLDEDHAAVGEPIDWWRVEAYEPDRLLRLRAEMKVPGTAWLEFLVEPDGAGGSNVTQTATYAPGGIWGYCYWAAMWPFHQVLFPGMLRRICEAAERET